MRYAEHEGWLFPEADIHGHRAILRDCAEDVAWVLSNVPAERRQVAFQAGGNVGVYAHALAQHFTITYTLEPDIANYKAMCWNLDARSKQSPLDKRGAIARTQGAVGEERGECSVEEVGAFNCGAHRVKPGEGIRVFSIDELQLPSCDLLWLDVEGSELPALKGAADTIRKHSPVIVTEEKHLGEAFGYEDEEIAIFLASLGYRQAGRNRNDRLYLRGTA